MLATGDSTLDQRVIPRQRHAQRRLNGLTGHAFVGVEVNEDVPLWDADTDVLTAGQLFKRGRVGLPAPDGRLLFRLILALCVDEIDRKHVENVWQRGAF